MERICKRTIAFFLLLMLGMLVAVLSVFTVASGTTLAQTADQQRSYRLEVAQTRGTIYDCKMRSFTGQQTEYAAAIVPTIEDAAALSRILTQQEMADIYPSLTAGKPFALRVKDSFTAEGADVFPVEKRYTDEQSAVHVIGYLDGAGVGVSPRGRGRSASRIRSTRPTGCLPARKRPSTTHPSSAAVGWF